MERSDDLACGYVCSPAGLKGIGFRFFNGAAAANAGADIITLAVFAIAVGCGSIGVDAFWDFISRKAGAGKKAAGYGCNKTKLVHVNFPRKPSITPEGVGWKSSRPKRNA